MGPRKSMLSTRTVYCIHSIHTLLARLIAYNCLQTMGRIENPEPGGKDERKGHRRVSRRHFLSLSQYDWKLSGVQHSQARYYEKCSPITPTIPISVPSGSLEDAQDLTNDCSTIPGKCSPLTRASLSPACICPAKSPAPVPNRSRQDCM